MKSKTKLMVVILGLGISCQSFADPYISRISCLNSKVFSVDVTERYKTVSVREREKLSRKVVEYCRKEKQIAKR